MKKRGKAGQKQPKNAFNRKAKHNYSQPSHMKGLFESAPLGMKVLFVYTLSLVFLNLLFLLFLNSAVVLGFSLGSLVSKLWYGLVVVLLIYISYGILKPRPHIYYLLMGWYAFSILDSLLSIFKLDIINYFSFGFFVYLLFLMFINGLTLGYVSVQRNYFYGAHRLSKITFEDAMFVSLISIFIAVSIILVALFGYSFYSNTNNLIEKYSQTLNNKDRLSALYSCYGETGINRDVCYMVIANSNLHDSAYCSLVNSGYLRYVCYRAVEGAG